MIESVVYDEETDASRTICRDATNPRFEDVLT